jgi:hypothetical protein
MLLLYHINKQNHNQLYRYYRFHHIKLNSPEYIKKKSIEQSWMQINYITLTRGSYRMQKSSLEGQSFGRAQMVGVRCWKSCLMFHCIFGGNVIQFLDSTPNFTMKGFTCYNDKTQKATFNWSKLWSKQVKKWCGEPIHYTTFLNSGNFT